MWWILVGLITILIYFKVIKPLSYWKERRITYQKPWPIVGNMGRTVFRKKQFFETVQDLYTAYPDKRYNGIHQFMQPMLLVRDIDLIKQITAKDFDHFTDHNSFVPEDVDPLIGKNIFFLKGQRWRYVRATLSPSFTSRKMRIIFSLLSDCAEQFTKYFEKQETNTVEIKEILTRFTNDAIASIAFGLQIDSLEERNNEFYAMAKDATSFSGIRTLKFFLLNISPAFLLGISLFPAAVSSFFCRIVKDNVQEREKEGLIRRDMIHLLMEARKGRFKHEDNTNNIDTGFATVKESHIGEENPQKAELTDDDIVAQAVVFFFAGFDTSATLMTFIAYEFSVNPDVRDKLQAEIDDTLNKCNGTITYEALLGLKYLDMVISETLRKWPPMFLLDRVCVKDYEIKPANTNETPFTIEKGMVLQIPVSGIHHNPKYFLNPDKFDPERFSDDNKHNNEPYTYLSFGAGPRNCIAFRFALLESKTLVFYLLSKFAIVSVDKTPIPLILSKKTLNLGPVGGFGWVYNRGRLIETDINNIIVII